jgi:hypothetical protein
MEIQTPAKSNNWFNLYIVSNMKTVHDIDPGT